MTKDLALGSPRAKLSAAQRRRCWQVGALALALITLGCDLICVIGIQVIFYNVVTDSFGGFVASDPLGLAVATDITSTSTWLVPGWLFLVAGSALIAVAIALSPHLLRRGRISRPWAVTVSSLAVALVPGFITSFLAFAVSAVIFSVSFGPDTGNSTVFLFVSCVTAAINIAIAVILGALVWWWMAYVFRAKAGATQ